MTYAHAAGDEPHSSQRHLSRPDITAAVSVIAGIAALLIGIAVVHAQSIAGPEAWEIALGIIALLVADSALVDIRTGHDAEAITFAEVMLAIALLLLPWPYLLPLAGVSVVAAHTLRYRAPMKTVFNASSFVIGAALAVAIIELGGVSDISEITPIDVVTIAVALTAFSIWNGQATASIVALSAKRSVRQVYGASVKIRSLVAFANIITGVAIVVLARWAPPALTVLPPLLALLYIVYRSYLTAARDRDLWQHLEQATKEMNLLDEQDMTDAALKHALVLFQADWVELALSAHAHGQATVRRLEDERTGEVWDGDASTCAVATLRGPDGDLGQLRIGIPPHVKLSERELQALKTYARTVTSTLLNVRLHAAVRREGERAAHEAAHDSLTGLSNRNVLLSRLARSLRDAKRARKHVALLLVDLDHFKEINDTLGHGAGDLLLRHAADRLRGAAAESATVARLGGDEFAILLPDLESPDAAGVHADAFLHTLAEPVSFEGMRLSIEGSMGIACYPDDGDTTDELLQRADVAMYQAKDERGAWRRYDPDRDESSLDRLELVAQLRGAIERGELTTYFQPQIDLTTNTVVGCEALVRWRHPTRGLLAPSEFISVVEHSGLVRQFALHVLDRAVAECALWHRVGRPVTVAVNLSARNLLDRQLTDDVARVLNRHGLAPEFLVLEITETTMMSELEVVEDVLAGLRRLGVELSVDDFGTGYSSLALLQRIAINEVKVDRSFVCKMLQNPSDYAIVRATIELAHSLGLRVVAEGVESDELREALTDLGCDVAQGYHFGRAAPAPEVRIDLAQRGDAVRRSERIPAPRRPNLTVLAGTSD